MRKTRKSNGKECFCAFCKSTRVVYKKRHISFADSALAFFASVLLSFICWQQIDPRAVIFFAIGLAFTEMFVIFRWRLSIACPRCGFDPVLYKKAPALAAKRVKEHMEEKRLDPMSVFSAPPKLPVIVKKSESGSSRKPIDSSRNARSRGAMR